MFRKKKKRKVNNDGKNLSNKGCKLFKKLVENYQMLFDKPQTKILDF